ncbi:MOSC domain-containing protein [Paraconexibacter sp.]|uniref:MOSC domain-containing protein n=1 Tax=Paraconexibacter sp. TaxID=2949640 RepID=UPI003569398E
MRWVLPPDDWNDRGAASLIACLASVLETGPEAIDLEPYDVDPGSGRLRGWLGERGLGLVPVADPDAFAWPGPWIAAVPDDADTRSVRWVVAFGSPAPAGIIWDPLRPTRPDGPAEGLLAGFVVAALVPGLPTPPGASIAEPGSVTAIVLAPDAGAPAVEVARARAVAGRGLEGDRYAVGRGTFSRGAGYGRELTLVEEELLGAAIVDGAPITPVQARRNVSVRGIVLDSLIGRRFRIGEVQCVGRRRCEPCAHLQRLGPPGVLRALVHRGGLRADILTDGEIAVGDDVVVLP